MECTLATLIACFSWSGFYVDTGLAYREQVEHYMLIEHTAVLSDTGYLVQETSRTVSSATPRQVYGHLAVGYEFRLRSLSINVEAISHDSRLDTNEDRGENAYRLNLRWFPFR